MGFLFRVVLVLGEKVYKSTLLHNFIMHTFRSAIIKLFMLNGVELLALGTLWVYLGLNWVYWGYS